MHSLKSNFIYKALLTFSNYLIGFVTFPYITRILGPDNFGLINFALNTIDYFLLFATMGIITIGTREIAASTNDRKKLNETFSRIFGLNAIFTALTLLIYFGSIFLIPKFHSSAELFIIGSAKILFTLFSVEWFFTGLEEFRYITIRSLVIKIIYVTTVFIFIKAPEDYLLYFILTIGVVVINSLINFGYSFKFVSIKCSELLSLKYFKQNFKLGAYAIMTSMYITFNVMFLGLVSSNNEVGYYATAVKLYFIGISLFGAYTSVMMPRVSYLVANNNKEKMNRYLDFSLNLVSLVSVPIMIVAITFAPEIICILSGEGYDAAITPMRIIMPATIFVWFSLVIVYQVLVPLQRYDIMVKASTIGGIIAVGLNILITSRLGAKGSAIILLTCEIIVTLFYLMCIQKEKLCTVKINRIINKNLINCFVYLLICYLSRIIFNGILSLLVALTLCGIFFLCMKPHNFTNTK